MDPFFRDRDYLYTIQTDPVYYYTGIMASSLQILVVLQFPSLIWVLFDGSGNLIDVFENPFPESVSVLVDEYGLSEAFFHGADRAIVSDLRRNGLRDSPIAVKHFFIPQYHIGISDFPELLREVLLRPSSYSEDELSMAKCELERWSNEGLFELWLSPDSNRWIDRSGKVESS